MNRTQRLRAAIKAALPRVAPPGGIATIERGPWRIVVNVGDLTTFVIGCGPLDPQSIYVERNGTPMGLLGVDKPGTVYDADDLLAALEGAEGSRAA